MKTIRIVKIVLVIVCSTFGLSTNVHAYYTGMAADVVVGQPTFTANSANQGNVSPAANTLNDPRYAMIADGKLFIVDHENRRVLIYNSVPTSSNASADVVIGQTSMTSVTASSCTASQINPADTGVLYVNGKLLVGDAGQNRILVFNGIPTTNGASADYVIGQTSLTSCVINGGAGAGNPSAAGFGALTSIATDGTKLFVVDSTNHRVLIYNTIPTASGAIADVVVGQPDFTTATSATNQYTFTNPRGLAVSNGKLIVGERGTFRILIYNSIPTTNGAYADVVLGQSDFTSANTSPPSTSSTVHPFFLSTDGNGRLYSSDRNASRYLIWNTIPTTHNAPADIVIGQPDFITTTAGSSAVSVGNAKGIYTTDSQMVITDQANHRVLIYNNQVNKPVLFLDIPPKPSNTDQMRFDGSVRVDSPYRISNVSYTINQGSVHTANPTDGHFDSRQELFHVLFSPKENQPYDKHGNRIDGYTLKILARNNNADTIDNLFYFSPFDLLSPVTDTVVDTTLPAFEFSVHKNRVALRDSLSRYKFQIRKGGAESTAQWETILDTIPIDFYSVKNNEENMQRFVWGKLETTVGVYETAMFEAVYMDDSSRIRVRPKYFPYSGIYQWKIVAVDKTGHEQNSGTRTAVFRGNSGVTLGQPYFPLSILSITGIGRPHISTDWLPAIKSSYTIPTVAPTFYGIAVVDATVALTFFDPACIPWCSKTFTTMVNAESRYGISIPRGVLQPKKKYRVKMSVTKSDMYNELPDFSIVPGTSSTQSATLN